MTDEYYNEMDYECGFGRKAQILSDDTLVDRKSIVDISAIMLKGEGRVILALDLAAHEEDWKDGYDTPVDAIILEMREVKRLVDVLNGMLAAMDRKEE